MNNVASYKNPAIFETDRKINLIYGLNGTGKSTLSNFLYDRTDTCFSSCSLEGITNEEVLVYNQHFINDYFYESDTLKGIFTLSKENKEAEEKIKNANQELYKLQTVINAALEEEVKYNKNKEQSKTDTENKVWEIKKTYSDGNRKLEYCLSGLMGRKEALLNYILKVNKPTSKPLITTEQLIEEINELKGDSAQRYNVLPLFNINALEIEHNQLFNKIIIGNENSIVASLIKKLGNSDWVKNGLTFLPNLIEDEKELCPFCQERTISNTLVNNIKEYFDKTYESDINDIKKLLNEYELLVKLLPSKEIYEENYFISKKKPVFLNYYKDITTIMESNLYKIKEKINMPSQIIKLDESMDVILAFNKFIDEINKEIKEHNNKIDNKDKILLKIKDQFWINMRWDYDYALTSYTKIITDNDKKIKELQEKIKSKKTEVLEINNIISEQQKKTVNIDEAITNINNSLLELGIDDFKIKKHNDNLYEISRTEKCENTFKTLSEGEKMIISFLYFRELCKGKKTVTSTSNKRIIVIDDPISSLSHIYIFNIGQMIKKDFFNSNSCVQVFLFTHSLYFFYEMTEINHDKRKEKQKLFRIIKNHNGSHISEMKYEEIQNDYQSYWSIIKDENQPPALIANCMRNIIKYFFNFVEKNDLNNVFQKTELQENKYQAFCRYINRESHSIGQNIFDLKEFNYKNFKDAFKLVFYINEYKEHYDKMIK